MAGEAPAAAVDVAIAGGMFGCHLAQTAHVPAVVEGAGDLGVAACLTTTAVWVEAGAAWTPPGRSPPW